MYEILNSEFRNEQAISFLFSYNPASLETSKFASLSFKIILSISREASRSMHLQATGYGLEFIKFGAGQ